MKGNKKILVIAVLLLLIAVTYGTYAIYKSSAATNAEVSAAAWQVEFLNGQTEVTSQQNLVLTCSNNNHVKNGVIAPGATCTGTLTIDATGTEVDVAYSVTKTGDVLADGVALSGDENAFTVSITDGGNGTISYSANPQTATVTVNVAWAGVEDATTKDPADTAIAGKTLTVPITVTAKQVVGN